MVGVAIAAPAEQTIPPTAVPVVEPVVLKTAELVDGDTITMSDGSTVRLIGIDTPERGECGFEEASMVLAQLINGQSIALVPGARDDVDRYGRLLRYVEVNGVDADLTMIESGRAIARYDGRDGYRNTPAAGCLCAGRRGHTIAQRLRAGCRRSGCRPATRR